MFLKCPPWIQAVLAQRITGLMTVCPPWLYSSCCGCREESGWGEGIRSETRGSPTSYSDSGGACVAFVGPQQCPRKWKVSGLRVAGTWPRWALGERWALCFQRSERRALALAVTISGACHGPLQTTDDPSDASFLALAYECGSADDRVQPWGPRHHGWLQHTR